MAKFTPLHDRVLIRRIEEQESVRGGIIIPDTAKDSLRKQEGIVIAVGKGRTEKDGKVIPLDVKEGDHVLFGKYSGSDIKLDGEEFVVIEEKDIFGVLHGATKHKEREREAAASRR